MYRPQAPCCTVLLTVTIRYNSYQCYCSQRLQAVLPGLDPMRLTTRAIGTLATDRARLRPRRLLADPKGADRGCIDVRATGVCVCCCCCCRSALAHGARLLLLRPRRAKLPAATAAGSVVVGRAQRAPKRGLAATHACHTHERRQAAQALGRQQWNKGVCREKHSTRALVRGCGGLLWRGPAM